MIIRFTRHAEEKFEMLARHGVDIAREKIIEIVNSQKIKDYGRLPLIIYQGILDENHVLRVVCRKEANLILIITFYPGRKTQYEKK